MATAAFTPAAIPLDRLCGLKPVGFFGGFRFANEPILVSERQVHYSISYQRKSRPKTVSEFGFDFDQTMSFALLRGRHTTSFFLLTGLGSGASSEKLLAGTRQRFSGFSQPRQCGEDVFRTFVTGGPPNLGGGGQPHRIMAMERHPASRDRSGRRRSLCDSWPP
jgi:hypothetical protein